MDDLLLFQISCQNPRSKSSKFWQAAKCFIETALDYSKDIVIGNGPQGPFDHLLRLKRNIRKSYGQDRFNPNDLFLYAVTDSGMNRKWDRSISDAVKAAIEGGATIVQLRFVSINLLYPYLSHYNSYKLRAL